MQVVLKRVGARAERVNVKDFAEASQVVRRYIATFGLGSSTWQGGRIVEGRKTVARVSYNGRVWPPGEWTPFTKTLYEP